jgi:hypothetical protein
MDQRDHQGISVRARPWAFRWVATRPSESDRDSAHWRRAARTASGPYRDGWRQKGCVGTGLGGHVRFKLGAIPADSSRDGRSLPPP